MPTSRSATMRLSPKGSATKVSAKPTSDEVGRGPEEQLVGLGRDEVLLEEQLHRVRDPLQEAGRAHAVVADAALHAGGDAASPTRRSRPEMTAPKVTRTNASTRPSPTAWRTSTWRPGPAGRGDASESGERTSTAPKRPAGRPEAHARVIPSTRRARRAGAFAVGEEAKGWGHRSISGATTSSDAMRATRSAIMRPGETASTIPMAMNEPVRARTRYAFSVPSETT